MKHHHISMCHRKSKKNFLSTHTLAIVGDPLHIRSHSIYVKDGHNVHGPCKHKKFFIASHTSVIVGDPSHSIYVKDGHWSPCSWSMENTKNFFCQLTHP
jgi:hypothetical protein